jgi:hypothetical protein
MEKVKKIINDDRQSTISEIAVRLGLSYETCQWILMEDFNTQQISVKFVP